MAAAAVLMVMVILAYGIRRIVQTSVQEGLYGQICFSGNSRIKRDACLGKGFSGAGAQTAADQSVRAQAFDITGQRFMAVPIVAHDFRFCNLSVFDGVNFKLFCPSEVLENFSVFISYCNFHKCFLSFLCAYYGG